VKKEQEVFENVKYHSRQKHVFLKAYYDIWTQNVGRKSKSIPSLEIFDLFAAYGKCQCEENEEIWDGTAALSIQCLENYSNPKRLWLNSYHKDPDVMSAQCSSLRRIIEGSKIPQHTIVDITNEPIIDNIDNALKIVNPKFPSIWILDPYAPSQLPWSIVEKVARREGSYPSKKGLKIRRPEMFINLITFSLARNALRSTGEELILDDALGIPKSEWRPMLDTLRDNGLDTQSAIVEIYGTRLEEIYGKKPIALKVIGTEGNPVYTIFLVTESDAGYFMMLKKGLPQFQDWMRHEWLPEADTLKARRSETRKAKKVGQKVTLLSDFT